MELRTKAKFLNDVCTFAKQTGCHIHLVAHARKGDESEIIGKEQIKGSSDIGNQVDNSLTVWRNKKKEEKVRANDAYDFFEPDVVVFCDKQRESGWEGKIPLFYVPHAIQFVDNEQEKNGKRYKAYNLWRKAGLQPFAPN